MWEAFSARFPYQETDDQLAAIADVVADLEKGSPMDRLVVGDVGFGKTEVAMRAAFVAALAGMQVAVVCPTTLLARQHYRSFAERFRGFPINVRPLSRFVSRQGCQCHARAGWPMARSISASAPMRCWPRAIRFKNLGLAGDRRRTAFRRHPQGTAEGNALRGACADADRHANSAHACNCP